MNYKKLSVGWIGRRWFGLGWVILVAGLHSPLCALAASSEATAEAEAGSMRDRPDAEPAPSGGQVEGGVVDPPMVMGRPGSITSRLERDRIPKEYLFQFPGVSGALKPWYDLKADLDKNHGFRFGISYTALYQKANDTFGPEDDAAGYDLDIIGTWTFLGRGTDSPTKLGFEVFRRNDLGTELPPQRLFTQYGALYSNAAPYGEEDLVIGELWIHQKIRNRFGLRIGKIFPVTAYDYFPFKNFRLDFIDFNHVTNATIPLPGNGLGAFAAYRPRPNLMFRLGVHDANADVQESGFDTYEKGEVFKILEVGYDTSLIPRKIGRPPQSTIHVSLWHQDDREEAGIDDGRGIGISVIQRFGRFIPFLRYGYADVNARGPTPAEQMVNAGLVIDNIFGQDNDRIGLGYTWADPADGKLDNQSEIDAYYRLQLTPEIQIGPTLSVIFDPVRNPDEDRITVWGFRTRVAL
jgi:porin